MDGESNSAWPGPAAQDGDTTEVPAARSRPVWIGWVAAVAVVALALGAFFVARAITGNNSNATASANNGTNTGNGNGSGNGTDSQGGPFGGRGRGTVGTITSINGSTLMVKTASNGTVKVTTTSSTRVTAEKPATLGDVVKGDRVTATGSESGSTIAATRVNDMGTFNGFGNRPGARNGFPNGGSLPNGGSVPPGLGNGQRPGGFAFGTVTSVNAGTIVMSGFGGTTTTVTTTSSTTITKTATISLHDLAVGQTVRVVGTTASDGTVTARAINEGAGQLARPTA